MKFPGHPWLFISLLLSVTTNAFSQNTETFTIKGFIKNPLTTKIHFANIVRCNSVTGCEKFMVNNKDLKNYTDNNRDIVVSKQPQPFVLNNITIKRDKELFFFFDSLGRAAQILVAKKAADKRTINVGEVKLVQTHLITGNVQFPDFIKKDDQKKLEISFSYTDENNDLYLVGFSQLNEKNSFNLRLIPGKYTVFFDVADADDNDVRVTKTVEISESTVNIGTFRMSTSLDDLVTNQASLTSVLTGFNLEELNLDEMALLREVEDNPHGVTLVYFFAGYCGPCLGKDGLSKYIKLTHEFPENFAMIGIHSDSYRMTKNCPTSQTEMMDFVQNKPAWQNIKNSFQVAQGNKILLSFQPASFAENLSINGYPTTLIFKDGKLQKRFVGSNPKVEEKIRELLKQ